MRTFIAIELPGEIKNALSGLQEELKKTGADIRWSAPSNIHLTLKFIGEIEEARLEKIKGILEEACVNKVPFKFSLASLGAFPNINYPRVIWVGVKDGDKETGILAGELEEKLRLVGIPKEKRPFSSHITLGRMRSALNREGLAAALNKAGEKLAKQELSFTASKITLFKSNLGPKGPIYEALKEVSLRAT